MLFMDDAMKKTLTQIELSALDLMYEEAVREKNNDLYRRVTSTDPVVIQGLLDQFFR